MHQQSIARETATVWQKAEDNSGRAVMLADAIDLAVYDRIESIRDEWKAAEAKSRISVYQRYDWVEAYLRAQKDHKRVQPFVVVGRLDGQIIFILPCSIHGRFVRRLKFIGGSHVNFNLGILPTCSVPLMTSEDFLRIFKRIGKLVPGIGYLALCCQPEFWNEKPNPAVGKRHVRSSNPAFLLDLNGGFDATLARGNAKRKRKKFRQQCRSAEELGGYEFHKPATVEEVRQAIDVFIEQKSKRLKELGIRDVFSGEATRTFLIRLATQSLGMSEPLLQLYTLRIGGKTAAVFGGGVQDKRLSGFFSSIDGDNFSAISPGEMLLYLVVEDACKAGYVQLDLGAGDERYKRSWSTETVDMYDLYLPYNFTAIPIVKARLIYGAIRRVVREDERYWEIYKKLRKLRAVFG